VADDQQCIVLTGVTGFLGREVLFELLTHTRATVVCVSRASSDDAAQQRLDQVLTRLLGAGARELVDGRVTAVAGDLTEPDLGLGARALRQLVARTSHIVHGAASVRFDLSLEEARRINLDGTLTMLELARRCFAEGRLERFGYISTAFVGGRYPEPFREDDLDLDQGFRNTYERSKFEAELLLRTQMRRLPITVVRPSIIVGHSQTGVTTGFNVIYWPLRMYADRIFRWAPASPRHPVDLVPVDYVARGVVEAIVAGGEAGRTYTLAAGEHAQEAHQVADMAADVFEISPPLLFSTPLDRWALPLLSYGLFVGPWARYASAYRQYLPYFLHPSRFETRNASALLASRGIEPPAPTELLQPVLEFARATNFGRNAAVIRRREKRDAARRRTALARALRRQQRGGDAPAGAATSQRELTGRAGRARGSRRPAEAMVAG